MPLCLQARHSAPSLPRAASSPPPAPPLRTSSLFCCVPPRTVAPRCAVYGVACNGAPSLARRCLSWAVCALATLQHLTLVASHRFLASSLEESWCIIIGMPPHVLLGAARAGDVAARRVAPSRRRARIYLPPAFSAHARRCKLFCTGGWRDARLLASTFVWLRAAGRLY